MMGHQILQAHAEFGASCFHKTLMRERQAGQAASWRAASSFPLVNYLPVAPRARA
jgi:hypothetical protein